MTKLKLYTLALTAFLDEEGGAGVVAVPGACVARNLGHAIDQGMSASRRLYPEREGWTDHRAVAIEIPPHLIEEVYTQEAANASP